MVRAAYDQHKINVPVFSKYDGDDDDVLTEVVSEPGYQNQSRDSRDEDGATSAVRRGVVRSSTGAEGLMDALALEEKDPQYYSESKTYCGFVALSTFMNMQVLALETDYGCPSFACTSADRAPFVNIDILITVLFLFEIAVSMFDFGVKGYFKGDPHVNKLGFHAFRCFDFFVVFLRVLDVFILSMAGIQTGLKVISAVRVSHMAFFVKRVRLVRAFRELWLVIAGFADTMKTVLWVALLQLFVTWVFGILITILVGRDDPKLFDFRRSAWSKNDYWGTVPQSMYSLFQVMTMDKWSSSLAWPLVKQRTWLVIIFIVFQCVAVLALLNTIVGVVVESTLTSARANEEKEGKERQKRDAYVMESLRTIFHEADTDGSGDLDWDELQAAKKNLTVRDRMKILEIPFKDLDLLFRLLDEEDSGAIKTDMFFRGCSRLRGPAMACDLHQMSVDLDRNIKWASTSMEMIQSANDVLADLLDAIDTVDTEIVKGDDDEKDPVLMARRGRNRQPKAHFLRAQNWVENPPHPLLQKDAGSEAGSKSRQGSKGSKASTKGHSLVRSSIRAGAMGGDDAPPPPPPLPAHLAHLQVQGKRNFSKQSRSMKSFAKTKSYLIH